MRIQERKKMRSADAEERSEETGKKEQEKSEDADERAEDTGKKEEQKRKRRGRKGSKNTGMIGQ